VTSRFVRGDELLSAEWPLRGCHCGVRVFDGRIGVGVNDLKYCGSGLWECAMLGDVWLVGEKEGVRQEVC
jgi:hypothetical protein